MSEQPAGTVTFLFTDIEGSTKRWQNQPAAMQAALTRHDALMRTVIHANSGYVFKTIGDAFCAAFGEAPAALAATVAAQRALSAESWGEIDSIRVRMALHTGLAELRDGDYFGQPVNRVARLLATGAGGQVLLSAATQELVRDHLPDGVELRALGEHRLKDLSRTERIYQVLAPGLDADFPPLKSLDHHPNNLPLQLTPFVGREREIAAVRDLLTQPDVRMVTLSGPGGTGKTRLSLQVAADLVDAFNDGVFFVPLEPVVDPALVLPTIAEELGVRESGGRPVAESLRDYLRAKSLLLVLDNVEQVTAAGPLLVELLRACPDVTLLISSRHVLRVQGEREFPVHPLALPDHTKPTSVDRLTQYEAVRLLVDRALHVKPDFVVTNENAPAVAEICVRLDGLPLAIELAAARIKHLSPQQLLRRLERRLGVLTGGSRDLPARQQTLYGAIAWSHDLLPPHEQSLFHRLSVFAGGFTLDAAEQVIGDGKSGMGAGVLDGVSSLVDKSLLKQDDVDEESRFSMLQTIHEFAAEQLARDGDEDIMQRRHALHFVALAEEAEPALTGPDQGAWLQRLDREHDNFRAALRWSEAQGEAALMMRLAGALGRHWHVHGHVSEGRDWLERAFVVEPHPDSVSAARAKVLSFAGAFAEAQGDYRLGAARLEEALAMWRKLGNEREVAAALNELAFIARNQGDYELAVSLHEEAIELADAVGDKWTYASGLVGLAGVAHQRAELAAAEQGFREVLPILRELGDRRALGIVLGNLGSAIVAQRHEETASAYLEESMEILYEIGDRQAAAQSQTNLGLIYLAAKDLEPARHHFEEALPIFEEHGNRYVVAIVYNNLGTLADAQGNPRDALSFYQQSLSNFADLGGQQGIAVCLEEIAAMIAENGHPEQAVRLFGAAAALRDAISAPRNPLNQPMFDRGVSAAKAAMGEDDFASLHALGASQPIDEAVAMAMTLSIG